MANYFGTKMNPKRFHRSQWRFLIILIPVAIFMGLPIVYIVNHAFKPLVELFEWPPRFFVQNPTFDNFIDLFAITSTTGIPMTRYLFNSLLITAITVFASIFIGSLAGFALSKLEFRFKNSLLWINNIAIMFVGASVSIPRYLVIEQLGLIDSFWVHIIPGLAIPVGLFLIKQFIDQIPKDLIEASRVDGANNLQIYWYVILPLIKPAIATIAIVAFQGVWNNTEVSNLYINDESLKTFAFYMTTLTMTGNAVAGQGMAAAASLIMFVPNLVVFIVLQKNVMNTMIHSGIK
jgi:ABC-type glycerol-3-phosphate transport system permease component